VIENFQNTPFSIIHFIFDQKNPIRKEKKKPFECLVNVLQKV
jgi:hypothetical protein